MSQNFINSTFHSHQFIREVWASSRLISGLMTGYHRHCNNRCSLSAPASDAPPKPAHSSLSHSIAPIGGGRRCVCWYLKDDRSLLACSFCCPDDDDAALMVSNARCFSASGSTRNSRHTEAAWIAAALRKNARSAHSNPSHDQQKENQDSV